MTVKTLWLLGNVVKLDPAQIHFKLTRDTEIKGIMDGDWDLDQRIPFEDNVKYIAVYQHFVQGMPWSKTQLFAENYADRFRRGETVRGASNMRALVDQYNIRVDGLYRQLKKEGFRAVTVPHAHVARDGEVMAGNDGGHRISMAKILRLPHLFVRLRTIHPQALT